MKPKPLFVGIVLLLSAFGLVVAGRSGSAAASAETRISGIVLAGETPVSGARVRVRATDNMVLTAEDGSFILTGLEAGVEVEVTAWADGHYIASKHINPPAAAVTLTLRPHHTEDHPSYKWADPLQGEGACAGCHPSIIEQWISNAHATAVDNSRFFSLYNGTNAGGDKEAGPGYLQDFPGTAGNCATCHAPGAAVDNHAATNMNDVRGQVTAGIHCDFCHKVGGVDLDEDTGSVYDNRPGVQSLLMLRPPPGDDIFFGPYDDVHDPDTYLPLISESQYCAPCHQFSFHGTPIYESYDEWLDSPYASMDVTCQDCHMPPVGDTYFALPEVGGVAHPPEEIPSHLQLGAGRDEFGSEYAILEIRTSQQGPLLLVTASIINDFVGHHFPTDFPGRHLLLSLQAVDEAGRPLRLHSGSRVPAWGGEQAGLPGKAYAKILADSQTGEAPVVSYWKPTVILSDNRIPALSVAYSSYAFFLPPGSGEVDVTAELRYRHLFADLMDQKEWDVPDDITSTAGERLPYEAQWLVFAPLVENR